MSAAVAGVVPVTSATTPTTFISLPSNLKYLSTTSVEAKIRLAKFSERIATGSEASMVASSKGFPLKNWKVKVGCCSRSCSCYIGHYTYYFYFLSV